MLHDVYKPNRHWKDIELWKDVTEEQWNDWVWQLTNTIKTLDDLKKVIHLTPEEEEGVKISTKTIPLNITPSEIGTDCIRIGQRGSSGFISQA